VVGHRDTADAMENLLLGVKDFLGQADPSVEDLSKLGHHSSLVDYVQYVS